MHQNAFGGRALPRPAGKLRTLLQTSYQDLWRDPRVGKGKGGKDKGCEKERERKGERGLRKKGQEKDGKGNGQ